MPCQKNYSSGFHLIGFAGNPLNARGWSGPRPRRFNRLADRSNGAGLQELLHSATVAICGGVTVDQLWHAVPSFPTLSEVWLHLLEAYGL